MPSAVDAAKILTGVFRQKRLDDLLRQLHAQTETGDSFPQFVIVGQIIGERFESSNRFEIIATKGQCRSQSKADSLLQEPSSQHGWDKVCADAD